VAAGFLASLAGAARAARSASRPQVRALHGHARRLYATVTDIARMAAALLAVKLTHGRLPSPFTARDVYRNEWTGLTEPRVVQGALACLDELGWLRPEAVRAQTAGGPACGFTSIHGWPRARPGRSADVGARRGAGNRQDPPRGFVSFVGWSPPSFFSRFFSRDQTLGIPNSLAASERLQRRPLEDRLTSGPPASRDATRSPLLPLPPAEFPMRSRESWAKAQQPASNSGQAP